MVKIAPNITPMLVFSVSYLFIFFALMGLMPILAPNLLYGGKGYSNFDVPDYFTSTDIENIKYFENISLTYPFPLTEIDFNPDINVILQTEWTIANPYIILKVILWEWWIFYSVETMLFTSIDGALVVDEIYIGKPELLLAWNEDVNASIFTAEATESGVLRVKTWFTDTNTTRNDIGQAFDNGTITLGVGFGIDDIKTSYNAFNLIGILLGFSAPEIFGASGIVAITLNLICNSPLYLTIAYLVFYFITSIIPFIRGA